ncbi:MAG: hypothetical protein ABS36_17925 [Acidobacteria bacterium SCN 69-37]|nr:MAG: hypothetical protein ABS36_17925 [Acidobacteria bacterium SCN 69-37]
MPSPSLRDSWPPQVDDDPRPVPADTPEPTPVASAFLSEQSPEFAAIRRAAADARAGTPSAALPAEPAAAPAAPTRALRRTLVALAAVAVLGLAAWPFRAGLSTDTGGNAPATAGVVATIVSRPDGATVFIDGEPRGVTPLALTLPAGTYDLELRNGDASRRLPLVIDGSTAVRESIDLAPVAPVASTGRLEIRSATPGTPVAVDGVASGVTPVTIDAIAPGAHRVAIGTGATAVYRTVTVEAGATATVTAPAPAPSGALGGWLVFTAPFPMQVFEHGRLLGTTRADRLMLPAGSHDLTLVAEDYELQLAATTAVGAGRTAEVPVVVPNGQLSINAVPWAEVWLDGQPLGTTPLANLPVVVGDHEVVWRHPEFGERRRTIRVTARTPTRVGTDLTQAP